MWLFIIFACILAIIIASSFILGTYHRKKALTEELNDLVGFAVSQSYIGEDGNSAIAIDSVNKKICLLKLYEDRVKTTIISYQDLISAQIFINYSEAAGTSVKQASNIRLRIVISDSSEPVHVVCFFAGECKTDSLTYRHALEQAEYWKGLLSVLISQVETQ
ncbi:MAG: hypothetical protein PHV50_06440 [Syntrophaceticus sp.]|nr:hypothetical protein [Syntrophaceticus sp.]MDD3314699.1 hypothetical protein [Syntrophaceticus sp.]MDD4360184.1 hypothetical protein [Syntrophaceticus sp.]